LSASWSEQQLLQLRVPIRDDLDTLVMAGVKCTQLQPGNRPLPYQPDLYDKLSGEAHLWYCYPERFTSAKKIQTLRQMLSKHELEQLQRYRYEQDRHRYLVSHALLRTVLSRYLNVEPECWEFVSNQYGRPAIIDTPESLPLKFNLTHTIGLCACVVTMTSQCGIDAEMMTRNNRLMPIAERMLSTIELETLRDLQDADLRERFFSYWTLREAYVKALGTGLGGSSKSFYFDIAAPPLSQGESGNAALCFVGESGETSQNWQLEIFRPDNEHMVTLAIDNAGGARLKIIRQLVEP
jgi:4'-phosphopantetheinyl transferase